MFDSYVLTLFYKAYYKLHELYLNSVLRKIELRFRSFIKRLSGGSTILKTITDDRSLIDHSLIYRGYSSLLKAFENIGKGSRNRVEKYSRDSFMFGSFKSLFSNKSETMKTISIFFMFFSAPLLIMTIVKNGFNSEGIIFLVIALFSIVLFIASNGVSSAVRDSRVLSLIKSIFIIDEEANSWK